MNKILLIDDDPSNREILKARLEALGHEVLEASNGEDGLTAAQQSAPALIFLDVMMPRLDGWHVCRALKSNPRTRDIPVVMLTALSQQMDELRGYESGVNEYLTKPWDPDQLQQVLDRWLLPTGRVVPKEH